MIELRDFNTAAEMRAHYKAVRARIFGPPPPRTLRPPAPPAPPPVPAPVVAKVLERAEQRRRDLINAALIERQEGEEIIKLAALHFGVTAWEIRAPGRKKGPVLFARQVAAYVMREYYGRGAKGLQNKHSLNWIGRRINRDHTCVLHAEKCVRNSPRLLEAAATIQEQLTGKDGPYVEVESYVRHENEAYTLKRTGTGVYL